MSTMLEHGRERGGASAWTREQLEQGVARIAERHGPWTFDIPLPHGVWTRGNRGLPHTRLRRLLQLAADLASKPLFACRVLDLGCLDGIFSVEFALHGARVTGIDVRESNLVKARFAAEALGLSELRFEQDDVRNVRRARYGEFDVILCSGLLYHLDAPAVLEVLDRLYGMTRDVLIVDTHVSLDPREQVVYNGKTYHGHRVEEHAAGDTGAVMEGRPWASHGNRFSFWLSRPSLANALAHSGFSSVHECIQPAHLDFGRPGQQHRDRCTFAAVAREPVTVHTSPPVNHLHEDWPEGTLTYGVELPPR